MAEAVAAFYAVETAVEGAAVGAYVASRPTVPLHVKFQRLSAPDESTHPDVWAPRAGQTLNVIKGKAYLFGGDAKGTEQDANVRVITLPSSLDSEELDFQVVKPVVAQERPLQAYSDNPTSSQAGAQSANAKNENQIPECRADHSSVSIDSNIFVLGGREARQLDSNIGLEKASTIYALDIIHCFSTQMSTWTTIRVNMSACRDGVPPPRTLASCTSSSHPRPGSGIEVTTTAHGTIFLHGGYDENGQVLRDTWSFDVSSRSWTLWPAIPEPLPQEVAGEGRIIYQDKSLCRVGDGFGKIMFINVDIPQGNTVLSASGPRERELALKPQSETWDIVTFGTLPEEKPIPQSESLPMPRKGAGFLPVTTGAGRLYHLYFMGQDGPGSVLNDLWSLQVKSQDKSGAAVKDKVRKVMGRSTGENEWALCEVVESTKSEGSLDLPKGMTDFAADTWTDLGGGNVLIWNGRKSDGSFETGGWVMTVE